MLTRYTKSLSSWIAILAVLFASLAPSISQAIVLNHHQTTLSQEICSAQGEKHMVALDLNSDTQPAPSQNHAAMHFEHCPYCASHVASVAIMASPSALFLAQINATEHIQLYAEALPSSFYQVSPLLTPHLQSQSK